MSDQIDRQAAVDMVRKCNVKEVTPDYMLIDKAEVMTELMMLPSADPKVNGVGDLISREYMKSLGGACIAQRLKDGDLCPIISIDLLPSADPEIIRCKDCKHYYYADNRIPLEQRYTCALDGDRWKPDSFCSFAERREE